MDRLSPATKMENEILKIFQTDSRYLKGLITRSHRRVSEQDLEDILQNGLINAWIGRESFQSRDGASLKTWIGRIVINSTLTFLRHERSFGKPNEIDSLDGRDYANGEVSVEIKLANESELNELARQIRRLPKNLREAIQEFLAGKDFNGKSTLRVRKLRAVEMLKRRMTR